MKKKTPSRRVTSPRRSTVKLPRSLTADEIMAAVDARWNEVQARLEHRGTISRRRRKPPSFELPSSVMDFLECLYREPSLIPPDGSDWRRDVARMAAVSRALWDAYRRGCAEGYIEGMISRAAPDHKRSATGNAGKRKALVAVGSRTMTRDERDALMAAEHAQLAKLMRPTPAYQRLAAKYDYESWQGVAAAIKAFRKRQPQ